MKAPALLPAVALAAGIFASTSPAANHVIQMTTLYRFDPDYLEIEAGDTVTWRNMDTESHDATSDTALWSTGDIQPDESATLQFDTPGTYPYRDTLYYPLMTGTIVVNATALPPSPALLTEPAYLPDGKFRFTITTLTAGKTNVIEASTNLLQWTPIATNVPAADTLAFTNSAAGASWFFRSFQIP